MVTRPATAEEAQDFFDNTFTHLGVMPSASIFLGWDFVSLDVHQKILIVNFTATGQMLNPAGAIQGGLLTAMLDDTMGPLALIMSAGQLLPNSTDIHTQYFRAARPGRLRCEAKITRTGRTLVCSAANLYNDKEQIVATATQTAMFRPFKLSLPPG